MKALTLARKTLLEFLREPLLLALVILLPPAFLVVNALGYGAPLLVTHPVWVMGDDERTAAFLTDLQARRYPDGRPVFAASLIEDGKAADAALKDRKISALVTIPGGQAPENPWQASISGDALSMNYIRASILLNREVQRFAMRGEAPPIRLQERAVSRSGPLTFFDQYTPGMIVFGILIIIPQTAMLVGREVRSGALRRLRLTRMSTLDLFIGLTLAQMGVAFLQIILVFLAALALGFHNHGALALAILVGLTISFSAVGLGLITACFVADDSQALNLGFTVTMLQVFLSGAFFPMPSATVFTFAGHAVGLFDFIPATHGMLALQQVLAYGANFSEIGFRFWAALGLSLVYFCLGGLVFNRLQMQRA